MYSNIVIYNLKFPLKYVCSILKSNLNRMLRKPDFFVEIESGLTLLILLGAGLFLLILALAELDTDQRK